MSELLFITHEYPQESGDSSFIKTEILFLSKVFNKIHILCSNEFDKNKRLLFSPQNVVIYYKKRKAPLFFHYLTFFNVLLFPIFYKELNFLFKSNNFKFKTLIQSVRFLHNAILFKKNIKNIISYNRKICLIYTYWYVHETLSSLLFSKKNYIPCITRTHRYDLYKIVNNYQPYKIWMDQNITKIFFISQHGYNYYINEFVHSNSSKYSISYLGIINNYKIKTNINQSNYFMLCSCSRIIPIKRINLIIDALNNIDKIKIHWIHIGDGYEIDSIKTYANSLLNSKDNISFEFKGFISNEKVLEFYNENFIDCFISTSESEGLPVSMMEAISFGIPIIATNVCGVSELVNSNIGILLDSNCSTYDISNAIINYYNLSIEEKKKMRYSSRKLWEQSFNAEINYKSFSDELKLFIN